MSTKDLLIKELQSITGINTTNDLEFLLANMIVKDLNPEDIKLEVLKEDKNTILDMSLNVLAKDDSWLRGRF